MDQPHLIKDGDFVIIQKIAGEHVRLQKLFKKNKILIEKLRFEADSVFGYSHGLFEVAQGRCSKVRTETLLEQDGTGDIEMRHTDIDRMKNELKRPLPEEEYAEDGLEKNASQKRQKLTHVEIGILRQEGANAMDLVSHLVSGNACFNERTTHAKDKYVRKKTQRYQDRVLILKPTIRLITESYYKRDPDRIAHMRLDQLGHMLALCGIRHGSKVFVFEQLLGLLFSSVVERLSGQGTCVALHRGRNLQGVPCLQAMDYTKEQMDVLYTISVSSLIKKSCQLVVDDDKKDVNDEVKSRRNDRIVREKVALECLLNQDPEGTRYFDSILCATRSVNPIDILEKSWSALAYSGTLVIYTPNIQHVIHVYKWLRDAGAINADDYKGPIKPEEISIIVVIENRNDIKLYTLALQTLQCYATHYGYDFQLIDFESTPTLSILCPQDDFFYARHCAVYHYLYEYQKTLKYAMILDADIGLINPFQKLEPFLPLPNEHIILSQRFQINEIGAYSYIIRNSIYGRRFLLDWADYFYKEPTSFHGSDNGALMKMLMDRYVPDKFVHHKDKCDDSYSKLVDWAGFRKMCICVNSLLYKVGKQNKDRSRVNVGLKGEVRITRRVPGKSWVRDIYDTGSRWTKDDVFLHGMKSTKMSNKINGFKTWISPIKGDKLDMNLCKRRDFYKAWNYNTQLYKPLTEFREELWKIIYQTEGEHNSSYFSKIVKNDYEPVLDKNYYVKSVFRDIKNKIYNILFVAHDDIKKPKFSGKIHKIAKVKRETNYKTKYSSFIAEVNDRQFKKLKLKRKLSRRITVIGNKKIKHTLGVCLPILTNFVNAGRFINTINYWTMNQVTKFYVYYHSTNETMLEILSSLKANFKVNIEIISWGDLPYRFKNHSFSNPNYLSNYRFQQLAYVDCLFRAKGNVKYLIKPQFDQKIKATVGLSELFDLLAKHSPKTSLFQFSVSNVYGNMRNDSNSQNKITINNLLDPKLFSLKVEVVPLIKNMAVESKDTSLVHVADGFAYHDGSTSFTYLLSKRKRLSLISRPTMHWKNEICIKAKKSWKIIR
uniref:tRNA (adenine(58)-N(1))-methyltransferase non-catalytic subunit TRM6 n=1 Tax=Rhabditophanes sp. KR3021 TaxID=114890 RepID=A0AC35UCX4_9BILA